MDAPELGKMVVGQAQEGIYSAFIDRLASVDVEVDKALAEGRVLE